MSAQLECHACIGIRFIKVQITLLEYFPMIDQLNTYAMWYDNYEFLACMDEYNIIISGM